MIKVPINDLQEGMVTAEPILDISGKVLLAAKAKLTNKHINILKTWDIDFVRIREAQESDNQLEAALKLDTEEQNSGHEPTQEVQQELKQEPKQEFKQPKPSIKKDLGINENSITVILTGQTSYQDINFVNIKTPMGSLADQESLKIYNEFLFLLTTLVENNFKSRDISLIEFSEVAKKLKEYIINTAGVIGYALRPIEECNELARHILGTSIVAGKIGLLLEYPHKDIGNIVFGSLLHDLGKVKMHIDVANKSRRLSYEEEQIYQQHVLLGMGIVKGKNWVSKEVLLLIAQHHERMDGKGFPMGFTGDKIHPYAKIVAIADYFDERTHQARRMAPNLIQLAKELPLMQDSFDPVICGVFSEYLKRFLLSNKVRLEDGRTGDIIYMHNSYSEPVIRTADGQFIDLNKSKMLKIENFTI